MRRRIVTFLKVLVFFAGVCSALVAAEAGAREAMRRSEVPVLRWHDFSSQLKVEQMASLTSGVDVVVVGTSMAQQDLVPSLITDESVSSYNAGLNGGVPVVMEPWLIEQVLPVLSPKTVVWGLSPLDLSATYGDATKNAYDQAFETRQGYLAEADRWVSQYSTLISSRAVLRDPAKIYGDEADATQAKLADAVSALGEFGERTVFDIELGVERQDEVTDRISPFQIDRDDLAAIARTVAALRNQNIEVVFVELPVPERFVSLMPAGDSDRALFSRAVDTLGQELEVEVLKASAAFENEDFVDFTHLSEEAAARFSSDIGTQLAGL